MGGPSAKLRSCLTLLQIVPWFLDGLFSLHESYLTDMGMWNTDVALGSYGCDPLRVLNIGPAYGNFGIRGAYRAERIAIVQDRYNDTESL